MNIQAQTKCMCIKPNGTNWKFKYCNINNKAACNTVLVKLNKSWHYWPENQLLTMSCRVLHEQRIFHSEGRVLWAVARFPLKFKANFSRRKSAKEHGN